MRAFRLIYYYIALSALFTLTACQGDTVEVLETPATGGTVQVRINVSPASPATTTRAWQDDNAKDDEMMNIWTVVITNSSNEVVDILSCKPTEGDREIDDVIELKDGAKYNFYSFANISAEKLNELLGLADETNNPIPVPTSNDVVVHAEGSKLAGVKFPAGEKTINNYTANVNGNLFSAFAATGDNGFGSYGIPMSNVQENVSIAAEQNETQIIIDLIVVRMLAKIELQVYNDWGTDVVIESVTLTDITMYNAATNNLKLFPNYTSETKPNGPDLMEDYEHGDIQPNLNGTPTTENVVLKDLNKTISATDNKVGGTPVIISFYVNESQTPTSQSPNFSHFFLKIKLKDEKEARYVLIDDKGTQENEKWNYIARNDYRIIPIVLDDYKLDIIPYDFPAIGVHSASIKEEDGIYTVNFHDYGHFHLQPVVTKHNTPTDYVLFTTTTPATTPYASTTWGLVNNKFEDSWGSWTDASKETPYDNNTEKFYRDQVDSADGDDAGGVPVWYANTPSNSLDPSSPSLPQWAPNTTVGYQPFIFGYIADPGNTVTADKKVYHEFTINLYKSGTGAARQMTYRLYMILDTQQMLYSRSLGASAARHTHGH